MISELQFLEDAERKQDNLLAAFYESIQLVSAEFYVAVTGLLDDLSFAPQDRMNDWRSVTRYRLYLRSYLATSGYDNAVNILFDGMKSVMIDIESYYEPYGMAEHSRFFGEAGNEALERTRTQLMEVLPESTYLEPVAEALESMVMAGARLPEMRRQLKDIIVDSEQPKNLLFNHAKQSLWMFHRNYSTSIANTLNLTHFYFDGVNVKHSRAFCIARKGKSFTKAEIEDWAKLDWQGKIAGTNKVSIFWLCGGHNCIDVLRPITKDLYNRLQAQS